MLPQNQIAFKEWAVVCAALAQGRQSLILRKGGIHEGCESFRVQHDEFWLYPTAFHQQADDVITEARPLIDQVQAQATDASRISLVPRPRNNLPLDLECGLLDFCGAGDAPVRWAEPSYGLRLCRFAGV
ncbi:MAG: DUF1802 family protein, partial [Planctomycetia bacterium]|nr:DUF1802 family protein [Planctomycetia bacterium]